ncbi:MAG: hypothetical protein P4M08_15005 [Oligoflexia bacterium]|nr:hypothetical protein [Oligoflexia bacterium]
MNSNYRVLNFSVIGAGLALVALVSMFSGFHSFPVPIDLAWQFSPLGLMQKIQASSWELESVRYFSGTLGFTPDYAWVFLKTCLCEFPLYWLCFRRFRFSSVVAICVAANAATHPLVFFVIPRFFEKYLTSALFSEAFAPLVEMLIAVFVLLRSRACRTWREAMLRSLWILAANLYSWELGMFL